MKKIIALLIAALMLASMVACGGETEKETTAAKTTAAVTEKETTAAAQEEKSTAAEKAETTTAAVEELSKRDQFIQECKEYYEKNGEYKYHVVYSYYNWFGKFPGEDRVVAAINEYTHKDLYIDVEFTMIALADFRQTVPLSLAADEEVGWFFGSGIGYSSIVNKGYCYDLETDNLLEDYGPNVKELIGDEFLDACRVSGVLYGLPSMKAIAISYAALMIGKEYLDGIGYEYVEDPETQVVNGVTWEDIDDIFAQLHAQYPDLYVWTNAKNWFSQGSVIDPIGGDNFGVLLDPINSLEVSNLFGCDEWYEKMHRVKKWNELGYLSKDAMTESLGMNSQIKAGKAMAMQAQGKPGYKTQISGECGREMIVFNMGGDIVKASGATSNLAALAFNIDCPEAYMVVMDYFYTSSEVNQLLNWGQEGIDYQYTDDGHVTFAEGVDAQNSEWYHTCSWEIPNQRITSSWVGDPLDLGEKIAAFNANAARSLAMGFTFDNSEYSSEYTALTNKFAEYSNLFYLGFIDDVDAKTVELNEELESNGLSVYINAKTEALDKWAKENGKK